MGSAILIAAAIALAGQASVIDGDTIEIHGARVRLAGIDAPESRQTCLGADGVEYRCGQLAAIALADFIARQVTLPTRKFQNPRAGVWQSRGLLVYPGPRYPGQKPLSRPSSASA